MVVVQAYIVACVRGEYELSATDKLAITPLEVEYLEQKAVFMGHAGAATGTRPRHVVRVLSSQHTQPSDGERRDIQHDDFDENIAANGQGGLYGRGVVSI